MDRALAIILAKHVEPDQLLDLANQFDRLTGRNVLRKGEAINLMIDESCGNQTEDEKAFFEFIIDCIQRMSLHHLD